jgi:hypothetical protein
MASETSNQIQSEFLRLVDETKEFFLSQPTSAISKWIFLTAEGEVEFLDRDPETDEFANDPLVARDAAEREFGGPLWLLAIMDKDTDFSASGVIELLPDLYEMREAREYYFASRAKDDSVEITKN